MLQVLHEIDSKNLCTLLDVFERVRLTTKTSSLEWYDILHLSWLDYKKFQLGILPPSVNLLERVSNYYAIKYDELLSGKINFQNLSLRFDGPGNVMPEIYLKAAYGRKRASISAVHFLEEHVGWRLRLDAIRKLQISESVLQDPFAPISMQFMTDLCDYLVQRKFNNLDFFRMGTFIHETNKNGLIARIFSEFTSPKEAYEFFFNDCMKFFEQNCLYVIKQISETSLIVDCITNPHVAAEAGKRHLGSAHICMFKSGIIASIPCYLGLPISKVKETSCVHNGGNVCRLEIDFTEARKFQITQPFLNQ